MRTQVIEHNLSAAHTFKKRPVVRLPRADDEAYHCVARGVSFHVVEAHMLAHLWE